MKRLILASCAAMLSVMMAYAQTPYVVWCEDNTTLYFTYRSEELAEGSQYLPEGAAEAVTITSVWSGDAAVPTYPSTVQWHNYTVREKITKVVFETSFSQVKPTDLIKWFYGCGKLETILGIENLKTDEVTSMALMFDGCSSLQSLDLSGFNTSKVTAMNSMFGNCSSLQSLNLNGFDTHNVDSDLGMAGMFKYCSSLQSLDLSSFSTEKVKSMQSMFFYCSKLTKLNLSHFDTSSVTNMESMFGNCTALKELDISQFNTSKVTSFSNMFLHCNSLENLDLLSFDSKEVTSMRAMFTSCVSLESLDLSNFNAGKVVDMQKMFSGCRNLKSLTFGPQFTTQLVKDMTGMFQDCVSLESLDLTSFHADEVTSMVGMFLNCSNLKSLKFGDFEAVNAKSMQNVFNHCNNLETIKFNRFTISEATSLEQMFYYCESLKNLDLSGFVTKNVTNMSKMFYECKNLETVDLSNFNIENVTTIQNMFYDCSSLKSLDLSSFTPVGITTLNSLFYNCNSLESIDLSHFSTPNVEDMTGMFMGCKSLKKLDLRSFDTSKVLRMTKMFEYCNSLTEVDLSSFNTSQVTSMWNMFLNCNSLTSLDLSLFNTSKVTNMKGMFSYCSSLEQLDLGSFDTSSATDMSSMFYGCSLLSTIFVGNTWSIKNLGNYGGDNMFGGCNSLVGSNGTVYNSRYRGKEFAHIDVEGNPGYLTGTDRVLEYFIVDNLKYHILSQEDLTVEVDYNEFYKDEINIPKEVTFANNTYSVIRIADGAFVEKEAYNSWYITSVTMPEGLLSIGKNAFEYCYKVTSVNIPSSVISLYPEKDNPFSRMVNLVKIEVSEDNDVYDSRDNCNAIIEKASNMLVSGCRATVIPATVTSIGSDAFYGLKATTVLPKISIPSSVQFIDSDAFGETSLKEIYVYAKVPYPIHNNAFPSYTYQGGATLYVPKGSKDQYKETEGWKNFLSIEEMDDEGGEGNDQDEDYVIHDDGTFTGRTAEGIRIEFKIIDTEKKHAQVGLGEKAAIDEATEGKVTIPYEVKIGDDTYFVKGIGDYGFYNCAEITEVWLTDGIEFIGEYAFYGCTKLRVVRVPRSVRSIPRTAFPPSGEGGSKIRIDWGDSDSEGGGSSYAPSPYCPDEEYDVVIPWCVNSLGKRTFSYCPMIRSMSVEEGNEAYDSRKKCNAIIETETNLLVYGCKSTQIPATVTGIDIYAFEGCTGLESINIPSAVKSIGQGAFAGCTGLKSVCSKIASPFDISEDVFTEETYSTATLFVPKGTISLYRGAEGWKLFLNIVEEEVEEGETEPYVLVSPDGTKLTFYYDGYKESREGTVYDILEKSGNSYVPAGARWINDDTKTKVTVAEIDKSFADFMPTSTSHWFSSLELLERIDGLEYLNTSQVTDMGGMFADCKSLKSLDLKTFDTSNVKYMWYIFRHCENLELLDVSKFNTAKVESFYHLFCDCKKLTTLDVSGFDTSSATDLSVMFEGCSGLKSIDVSHFCTDNVVEMSGLFSGCSSLESVDVSHFNTEKVIRMAAMFYGCTSLTELDLTNFNTAKVQDVQFMFLYCTNLNTIYVGDGWSMESVIVGQENKLDNRDHSMFLGCTSLIGGLGTVYSQYCITSAYAHVDTIDNPGYLSRLDQIFGDADGNGEVDDSDIGIIVDKIVGGGYFRIGDFNGDGVVNVADVVRMIKNTKSQKIE